jgi:DNA-binding transcriptional MocR family regulator
MQRMTEAVSRHFPEGTKATRPTGGQVLWVELPLEIDTLELYRQALHEKISIAPGPIFSATRKYSNCIRLNCCNPWSNEIEDAVIRLGKMMAVMVKRGGAAVDHRRCASNCSRA